MQDLEGRGTAYLLEQSERLMDSLRKLPSVASVTTQFNAGVPQRRLRIDKEQALASGVDLGVLYGDLTTLLGGAYVNNFSRFGKLYQTYIQAAPAYRMDKRSLDSYYVASSSGESVPVSSLVEVVDTVGVEYVSQFNLYRSVSGLRSPPPGAPRRRPSCRRSPRTAAQVLPDDVGTAWSGTSFQEANASKTGGLVYALALVFVFLALAALYESWGLPLAILMSVPVAVLGAVLFVGGTHLMNALYVNDIYMQISLVMLIGLAAKNAILVVEYADRLFREQGASLMDAAIGAAKLRVRPIIMTAFAFILGVMPLVFASGVYATARNIMGVALVGGMLFATLLGIFVYPALYYFVGKIGGFEQRRERKKRRKHNENETYDHRRRDAGRLHPEIYLAAGRRARKLSLRRGVLTGHDGSGERWRELFGDTMLNASSNGRWPTTATWPWPPHGSKRPGPTSDDAGAIPAADRHRCSAEGEYTPKPRSCSRMPSSRPSRGELSLSEPCATPNAPQRPIASTGGAGGRPPSLAAEVATTYFTLLEYERDLRSPVRLRPAARIGRADDSMFRYGMSGRRGAGAGPEFWSTPPRRTFRNTAAP